MLEIKVVAARKVIVRQLDFLSIPTQVDYDNLEILGKVKASVVENDPYHHHDYLLVTTPEGVTGLLDLPRNSWGIEEVNKQRRIVLV